MYTYVYLKGYMVIVIQFDTYMITSFYYIIHPKGYMIVFFFTVVLQYMFWRYTLLAAPSDFLGASPGF